MIKRSGLILVMTVVACLGCRRLDPTVDLLESELRWMEDQLYLMEDEYQKKCAELASCRRENRTLRQGDGLDRPQTTTPADRARPGVDRENETPDLTPPAVEEGDEIEPQIEFPQPAKLPLNINIRPASKIEPCDPPTDAHVTKIALNSRLTGGLDLDGRKGDEGLMVVVEPKDAEGQYVPVAGKVEIVVLDLNRHGDDARVARWDFESTETVTLLRTTLFGRGIHLELPWPNEPPESDRLRVYVRYTTADGRPLRADREIHVELFDEQAGGWTPAARSSAQTIASAEPATTPAMASRTASGDGSLVVLADGQSDSVSPVAPHPDSLGTQTSILVPSDRPKPDSPQFPSRSSTRPAKPRATASRPTWRPYR